MGVAERVAWTVVIEIVPETGYGLEFKIKTV
jgi:hypothetical protein